MTPIKYFIFLLFFSIFTSSNSDAEILYTDKSASNIPSDGYRIDSGYSRNTNGDIRHLDVPNPVDKDFVGVITLDVAATDISRKIFWVNQKIPVQKPGILTLLYPQTEIASHGPSLNVANLAGLIIKADGQRLKWYRANSDPHAFHINVPDGITSLDISYQVIAGTDELMPDLVNIQWQKIILYPAGWYASRLIYNINLILPKGLETVSSLRHKIVANEKIEISKASLETLLDTPFYGARYVNRIELLSNSPTVVLNVIAERPSDTVVPKKRIDELKKMVEQTLLVFRPKQLKRYDFIVRLSDGGYSGGTEHATSGEIMGSSVYFTEWDQQLINRDIIPHELVHAWNGLSLMPADLWVSTPNERQGTSLLWVYEGQTEMWGRVLAARSGLRSKQETLDILALDAAEVSNRPGRSWRPLSDDVNYPSFMLHKRVPWKDWQRRKDYYKEGVLLWLEVEAIIRSLTAGTKGLDDFSRLFFAQSGEQKTYTFESLCSVLNSIAPYDWKGFFDHKVDGYDSEPLDALEKLGWVLTYDSKPSEAYLQNEKENEVTDLSYSIGLSVSEDGDIASVSWQSPAFLSGLSPRTQILSVAGKPYSREVIINAVRDAHRTPIQLEVEQDKQRRFVTINYKGTLRYPKLKRLEKVHDGLSTFLKPLANEDK